MSDWNAYQRLRSMFEQGDAGQVVQDIDAIARGAAPLSTPLANLKARALAAQGLLQDAIDFLILQENTGNADYWTFRHLAEFYRDSGLTGQTARYYRKSHALAGWFESERNGYSFTHDYFSNHIEVWRRWFDRHITQTPIRCLEIGSWQGGSATWLLDKVVSQRGGVLVCVDTFEGSSEHRAWLAESGAAIEDIFDANISRSGHRQLVQKLVGPSQSMLPGLIGRKFDFIYIDGAHEAKFVIQDTVLSWNLLDTGGFLLFDDMEFKFDARPEQNTARAVEFFISVFKDDLDLIEQGSQLLLRRL